MSLGLHIVIIHMGIMRGLGKVTENLLIGPSDIGHPFRLVRVHILFDPLFHIIRTLIRDPAKRLLKGIGLLFRNELIHLIQAFVQFRVFLFVLLPKHDLIVGKIKQKRIVVLPPVVEVLALLHVQFKCIARNGALFFLGIFGLCFRFRFLFFRFHGCLRILRFL